jgi:O-antigen ligase
MLLNLCIAIFFLARKDRHEIYPFIAKMWFFLLLALDGIVLVLDFAFGGDILSAGVQFFSLLLFVFALHAFTVFWFFMRRRIWIGSIFLILICLCDLFWLSQSQTRAAAVGLAGAMTFMALLYVCRGTLKPVRWASALLVLQFIFMPVVLVRSRNSGWLHHSPILSRLSSTSFAERRFIAWKAGFSGILDQPVFGWGLEHYRETIGQEHEDRLK